MRKPGKKPVDVEKDLGRKGFTPSTDTEPKVTKDKETGLPLIECKHAAMPQKEITPKRAAAILLSQEVSWHHAACG